MTSDFINRQSLKIVSWGKLGKIKYQMTLYQTKKTPSIPEINNKEHEADTIAKNVIDRDKLFSDMLLSKATIKHASKSSCIH